MFVIVLKEFVIYSGFRFLLVSISDSNCKQFTKMLNYTKICYIIILIMIDFYFLQREELFL